MSGMLRDVLMDARGWTAETVGDPESWYVSLSEGCLAALEGFARRAGVDGRGVTEVRVRDSELRDCAACLRPARKALGSGRGFVVVRRIPVERVPAGAAQAMYWGVGQLLGEPFVQDVKGTLLYDVRDTGQNVRAGARFSVTNAESSFHTDGAFNPQAPDLVGLLCLRTAMSGGQSQLVSAVALHNELLRSDRGALEMLYGTFCFDRRGQFRAGESPVLETPLFTWDGEELRFRYLNYYIQVGHEMAKKPLTPERARALEAVEALVRQPGFQAAFSLKPGEMLFANNRWILHNRTAFEDLPEPERRRHYVRLWLERRKDAGEEVAL